MLRELMSTRIEYPSHLLVLDPSTSQEQAKARKKKKGKAEA
jgi:hypothetical protein